MKLIQLRGKYGKGKCAIVDDEDYDRVNAYKWRLTIRGYVVRGVTRNNKRSLEFMHRFIMNTPPGMDTDHKDLNPLDNRKLNLRVCSRSQNGCNRGANKSNTSGYKGVSYHKREKRWRAAIRANGKTMHIGSYRTREEAALAYRETTVRLNGEFARW